jgi:putative lipoprotein
MEKLSGVLEVTVTYLQRIALRPGSRIEVALQDVSRMDAPALELAKESRITAGEQVPFKFELSYEPTQIDPRMTYVVAATIHERNKMWRNTTQQPVLTHGNPTQQVEVVVQQVA